MRIDLYPIPILTTINNIACSKTSSRSDYDRIRDEAHSVFTSRAISANQRLAYALLPVASVIDKTATLKGTGVSN